jgi:hypothetical protein
MTNNDGKSKTTSTQLTIANSAMKRPNKRSAGILEKTEATSEKAVVRVVTRVVFHDLRIVYAKRLLRSLTQFDFDLKEKRERGREKEKERVR